MNIYVGNLSWDVSDDELRKLFEEFGTVTSASVIQEKYTHRSRGFGFVEMPDDAQAQAAINGLNGKEFKGRPLKVTQARPQDRSGSSSNSRRYQR